MRVVFHHEAHAGMIDQARFYESKSLGLGSDFLDAVEAATRRVSQSPYAGPIERANIRKVLVSGFP
jgi:hypothetical protein